MIDAFARRIVGWWVSRTAHATFVLDALEQALHARKPVKGLVHHSDRGSQYVSIKYSERLAEAKIDPSVGSVGDSAACPGEGRGQCFGRDDQRSLQGRGHPPARTLAVVRGSRIRLATWVDRFNNRRLLGSIGNFPPAEAYAASDNLDMAA